MAVPYKLNYFEIETGIDSTSTFIHTGDLTATKVKKYLATSNDILLGDGTTTPLSGLQPTGNYITALTGEATATGPGSVAITLTNSAVIGKVLTGLSITGSAIASTDTILQAFGKVQNQINGKQDTITLTTTGTSGAATFISNVLNIPQYTDAFVGTVTSVAALTLGTTGTDLSSTVANSTTTPVITLNVPTASAANRGALSAADWTTFNSKQDAITLTTTGSSGASTFISNTLNVPTYTLSGLGGVPTSRQLTINGTSYDLSADRSWSVGTVTSVGITMPAAFSVASSPVTSAGTIAITGAGLASQYIRGDGALGDFPNTGGGGSSVSYYLNGSVSQGTIGGNTYYEMNKTPVIGTGTDFSIATDGYIAQFITDANDPASLLIPGGNWNVEMYFSTSSSGGTPSFYVEVYKYDGSTFTLLGSSAATPEGITNGTAIDIYYTSVGIPETVLTITDRLAIRVYVTHSGRTITLHTEDNHLSEIVTTFSNGLTALNGLTKQVQFFAVGTTGTDFNISSSVDTHTFNIPSASATARGLITTGTQTIAGAKTLTGALVGTTANFTGQLTLGSTITNGTYTYTLPGATGTLALTSALSAYVPYTGATSNVALGLYNLSLSDLAVNNINANNNGLNDIGALGGNTFRNVYANSFVKTSGTSSQFLKADGSVDSNSYALASSLSGYLPLTGGTLTGTLYGIGLSMTGTTADIVQGTATSGKALRGTATTGWGLYASATTGVGVQGNSSGTGGTGVFGSSVNGYGGVFYNDSTTYPALEVNNNNESAGNIAVFRKAGTSVFIINSSGNISNGTYTYTLPSATGTLALTSALSSYLPLSGGTLTGALSGTSATFSGNGAFNTTSAVSNYSLDVRAATNKRVGVANSNSLSGANLLFYTDANAFADGYIDATKLILQSNSGGNVGIGTTSPGSILDVQQSNATNMGISFMNTFGATSNTAQTVDITSKLVGSGLTGQVGSMIRTGKEGDYSSGAARDAYMSFSTAENDALVERMRITSGGNVLIGTTTDGGEKLQILGSTRISGNGTYTEFSLKDGTASGSTWFLLSGFPALGDFTIRESGVANHLVIKKTTGAATFSSSVTASSSIISTTAFGGTFTATDGTNQVRFGSYFNTIGSGNSYDGVIYTTHASSALYLMTGGSTTPKVTIASTGAATFSSSVTATGGLISNGGGIGYGGGELGFAVTTGGATSGIYTLATASPIIFFDHRATSNTGSFAFRNGTGAATTLLNISGTGVVTINNLGSGTVTATSGVLSAVSDMNLKIEDGFIDNALEKVLNLKPRYFHWNEESGLPTDIRQLGFYAQEVNEALGEEAANSPKTKNENWGIYDRGIIAMLTKAIQELKAEIDLLKGEPIIPTDNNLE